MQEEMSGRMEVEVNDDTEGRTNDTSEDEKKEANVNIKDGTCVSVDNKANFCVDEGPASDGVG